MMNPQPMKNGWYLVDWQDVWMKTGLAPQQVPGIEMLQSARMPPLYPARVHLTHLQILGFAGIVYDAMRPIKTNIALRPHQVAGVNYIRQRRGTLLADEMRVGKTATTMYAHDPEDGCMFVVGPLAARAVWHEWSARRFGPCSAFFITDKTGRPSCSICLRAVDKTQCWIQSSHRPSFLALEGRKYGSLEGRPPHVVFCHYAIVPTWRACFDQLDIGTLVVDEVHLPQSGMQSRKSVTSDSIRFLNSVAKRAIFLSGSPLWNKPKGLWHILDMLNPGAWGDFWSFARRYCDAQPTAYGWSANGSSNEDELQLRLREVMLRRTWVEVAKSLPPINRSVEIVPLPEATRDRIEETAARIRSAAGGVQTVVGDLARLRKMYAKEKASAAVGRALESMAEGHSVVVWTWHRDVCETIMLALFGRDKGSRIEMIHGDMPADVREQVITELRATSDSAPVCLVATMGALATAVNLNFADVEIFAELDWNPDSIAQAEMRPFDGTRPISCIYLVADCDTDQKLADALLAKFEIKDKLGVAPGVGSVADVLSTSLGVSNARTLDALAASILDEVADG